MTFVNLPELDEHGRPINSPSAYEYASEDGGFDGYFYTCPANTLSIFDEPVTKVMYIQGAICWWDAPTAGDYGEFSIVDKDDVLGLFATYGLTVGVDVLELAKYVRKFYPAPWKNMSDIRQRTAGQILPGLYMRFAYNNTHASNEVKCAINYVDYSGP